MAYLHRVALVMLCVITGLAHAGIPTEQRWGPWVSDNFQAYTGPSFEACLMAMISKNEVEIYGFPAGTLTLSPTCDLNPQLPVGVPGGTYEVRSCNASYNGSNFGTYSCGTTSMGNVCPEHSTYNATTDSCTCDSGWVENAEKTACVAPPDKCDVLKNMPYGGSVWADFGIQSRESYLTLSGTQTTTCAPEGCQVSGTVGGCGRSVSTGRTFCDIEDGKFTGTSCEFKGSTDEPPPGDDPDDDEPDNKPPAPCPTGKCHGEVNGVRVCVPCRETNDPPPKPPTPPTPPSSDAPPSNNPGGGNPPSNNPGGGNNTTTHIQDNGDGTTTTTTTTNSSGTNCTGDKCTTTTTSTTTSSTTDNSTGQPTKPPTTTSSTQQTEENRDDFCRKNPSNVACKGNNSTFGGSCGGAFVCDGDAIQCAIARDQLRRNCQAFEPQGTQEEGAYSAAKGQTGVVTGDNPNNATFDVSVFSNNSPLPTSGSGVSDLTISVLGRSVTLPFSKVNQALEWLGMLLVAVAWIAAYRIVTRG